MSSTKPNNTGDNDLAAHQNLRIGIVGHGELGEMSGRAAQKVDGVDVVAVADVSEQGLAAADEIYEEATCYNTRGDAEYTDMLDQEDLDGVIVATPHSLHFDQINQALERGIAVETDKPLTVGPENAAKLVEKSRAKDVPVAVGYQRQFQQYGAIRDIIESGVLGEVGSVDAYLAQNWIQKHRGEWRHVPEISGGGNLMDSGSHLMYGVLAATDAVVNEVSAQMDWYDQGIEEVAQLDAKLDREGQEGVIDADIEVRGYTEDDETWKEHVEIKGSEADLVWDDTGEGQDLYLRTNNGVKAIDFSETGYFAASDFDNANQAKINEYVELIRTPRETPQVSAEDAFKVVAATAAAYESAHNGGQNVEVENDPLAYLEGP